MSRLKQLENLRQHCHPGWLTAAARAEGVAPAIVGRRLDALEERLGVKLLVRTTRSVTLTQEGAAFLEDCQRLLADLANAEASVSAGGVRATGLSGHHRAGWFWPPSRGAAGASFSRPAPGCVPCLIQKKQIRKMPN